MTSRLRACIAVAFAAIAVPAATTSPARAQSPEPAPAPPPSPRTDPVPPPATTPPATTPPPTQQPPSPGTAPAPVPAAGADPAPLPAAGADPAPGPAAGAPSPGTPATTPEPARGTKRVLVDVAYRKSGVSPDLTLGAGVRVWRGEGDESRWWTARARAGVMLYREPSFLILGLSGQLGALDSSSLGIEAEYVNLWRGFWFQGGVYPIDSQGGVIVGAGAGYALLGLEYQRRVSGDRKGDQTLAISLHLPLGVVRVARKRELVEIEVPISTAAAAR